MWLACGDRNAKLFHGKANAQKNTNSILKLKNSNGIWCSNEEEIGNIVEGYFKDIFTSKDPNLELFPTECIRRKIPPDQKAMLEEPYSAEEVEAALRQFNGSKLPGPDGMPAIFFQKFWNVVGRDVTQAVLLVLNGGSMPPGMNHTFITLIPKTKSPRGYERSSSY